MSLVPVAASDCPVGKAERNQEPDISDSSDEELGASFQHQESEIKEEVFTPDIEQVEQVRLEEIVRTRSMLRGAAVSNYRGSWEEEDLEYSDHHFISREEIQALHHQLSTVTEGMTSPVVSTETCQDDGRVDGLDYVNEAAVEAVLKGDDYINQAVVDMVLNDDRAQEGQASAANLKVPVDDNLQRVSSSNGYNSQGNPSLKCGSQRKQPVASMDQENLGEFEKRLILAKRKSKQSMPDMFKIPWYHPGISRHIAECLLVYKDTRDGTYLLRDCVSDTNTVTLSVRCQKSVKHYKVTWDGRQFLFGLGKFNTLEEFKDHFVHQPVISGDSGVLVQLRYPYPRGVSEPAIYHEANVLTDVDPIELEARQKPPAKQSKAAKFTSSLDFSINSKEGYLTKMGFHRKNWKKRWFVLYKNELKYFCYPGDKEALRVINLDEVTGIDRDDSVGKACCFRLVTSYRTFYMYATSEVEANEWVQILDWRLKQQSRH